MRRRTTAYHRKPSKLALTLSLFFLSSVAAAAASPQPHLRSWRPDSELPGAKFVLGDGKNEGSKVKGYEGEWPLWSSFRKGKTGQSSDSSTTHAAASSGGSANATTATTHVCAPIGECEPCPDDVIHLPYCRPYNNRRRVACSPVTNPTDPKAIQSALTLATAAKTSTNSTASLGYEACGKSAKQEARDYFEMIAVIASIAIFSVWAFVQRQKLLFRRQNQQLQSRVTGQRRASGIPPPASPGVKRGKLQGNRKMRAARLAHSSVSR
ncbi:hypothetical protein EX895_001247 [Sporisorium graminicola]|uniref:Uncharacterized protein n=1 Tax=Sporisorium graminicola TaxID=280036 RepID=A0A4V6EUA6_9BASI|nr:hypothetical protein EX895_001247 [Sporisorium graminicola]TKY89949.1 hypothetical protein EX895_001247 [Sporisorium graminicola]